MVTEEKRRDSKVVFYNLKNNQNNKEDLTMKFKFVGVGAAGNKAAMSLVEEGIAKMEDVVLVNSTSKDIPKDFKGKVIILSHDNKGCGKERTIAREYAITAMRNNTFDNIFDNEVDSVLLVTSVEGGTGSGATPIIGQYCHEVLGKNVQIVAFTGFEDDTRGLQNTIEFFQDLDFDCGTQTIKNSAFMAAANENKLAAEQLANEEFVRRVKILIGNGLIDSSQNIDEMDMLKIVCTTGYKTVESIEFDDILMDIEEFNKLCKKMIFNSKSLKCNKPSQVRMGVFLNIKPESENAIDYKFDEFKSAFGIPFETFFHRQYDGGKQYIRLISSGMKLPLDEVIAIHERYVKASESVDKRADDFFSHISGLSKNNEDSRFDMVRSTNRPGSKDNFFKSLETQPKKKE